MKSSIILIAIFLMLPGVHAQKKAADYAKGGKTVKVFTTAMDTDMKLSADKDASFMWRGQPFETEVCVFVDPTLQRQTMLGIGGAFTDASAEVFYKLSPAKQDEFIKAYFDKQTGIGYTLGRTTIHSSDFGSYSYTYVKDNDKELKTFDIAHEREQRIPMVKWAMATAGKLTMYASPWSPPAWMKDNNSMLQGGKLKNEFRQSWANYYVKYIKAMEKEGIPFWGISIQNEPMAKQTWESCIYTAEEETEFLKNYLGPTMAKAGLGAKKIIAWDHNRDLIFQRASTMMADPAAAKYIWGFGFHWYETWAGGKPMFDNVRRVYEAFPTKNLIFTEGTNEKFKRDSIHSWVLGERYGLSMINDFNNGTVAWTDWNILLDEKGGPNHVGNFCFAPVHADLGTGELIYSNSYYYIGHFSKYIKPGAKRIQCSSSRSVLQSTAFLNPDGKVVVVVMNNTDNEQPYKLWVGGNAAEINSKARSISTLIF